MAEKRAYHETVARSFLATGRHEEAEKHLVAAAILTDCIEWEW